MNYARLKTGFLIYCLCNYYNHKGKPVSMTIEPCNICNLKCAECPSGQNILSREKGIMELPFFNKIVDDVYTHCAYLNLYFQGEPMLNSNIFDFIKTASEKKIYSSLSTNAQLLNEDVLNNIIDKKLDRIIISMDGATQDVYEKYRVSGSLELVKNAILKIVQLKKQQQSSKPFVIVQFLVTKQNENQISDIKAFCKTSGVDMLTLKSMQLTNPEKESELLPSKQKFSRYKKTLEGKIILKKQKKYCWRSWSSVVVTWDGNVLPCCFDKDANHIMGNVSDNNIAEILSSNKFHHFRKNAGSIKPHYNICKNCI